MPRIAAEDLKADSWIDGKVVGLHLFGLGQETFTNARR